MYPTHASLPVEMLVVTDPRPPPRVSITYQRDFVDCACGCVKRNEWVWPGPSAPAGLMKLNFGPDDIDAMERA